MKRILLILLMLLFPCTVYADCYNEDCNEDVGCYACIYNEWDEELKTYTQELCKEYDIPYHLVLAIIYNESGFQSDAKGYNTNNTCDYGLMQLNDCTLQFFQETMGVSNMEELMDGKVNIINQ